MNAQKVINLAEANGLILATKDGALIINGAGDKHKQLTPEIKGLLIKWKPKLIALLKPKLIVLYLTIDGKQVTCLDPNSSSSAKAIQNQRERWGTRLTGIEIRT